MVVVNTWSGGSGRDDTSRRHPRMRAVHAARQCAQPASAQPRCVRPRARGGCLRSTDWRRGWCGCGPTTAGAARLQRRDAVAVRIRGDVAPRARVPAVPLAPVRGAGKGAHGTIPTRHRQGMAVSAPPQSRHGLFPRGHAHATNHQPPTAATDRSQRHNTRNHPRPCPLRSCKVGAPPCTPSAVLAKPTRQSKAPAEQRPRTGGSTVLWAVGSRLPVAVQVVEACTRRRVVIFFGWVFFLISVGGQAPHVRPMGRSCGEPNEIELTPIGVKLNGSRGVLHGSPSELRQPI